MEKICKGKICIDAEHRQRDYILHGVTMSLCPQCLSKIPAKILIKNNHVYLLKTCEQHGDFLCLLEEDAEYYLNRHYYDKPGTISKIQTVKDKGCPFDCGLCPEHDQHSCIALIEITDSCNLQCPVCYANGRDKGCFLGLEEIGRMMDLFQDSEFGEAEILQISGGEPTIHPDIIKIIELARKKNIKYVMVNTNGLRIADDIEFVKQLSRFVGGFEVYLQFDGFAEKTYQHFNGKNLWEVKQRAINNLTRYNIPLTLVSRIEKGINDNEIGRIVQFGIETSCVRGINFQPVACFGRGIEPCTSDRITMTGILQRIEQQTKAMIKKDDFIPLPCNVEKVAITYLYRKQGEFIPITRNAKIRNYLHLIKNTFAFDAEAVLQQTAKGLLKGDVCSCLSFLKDFMPMAPLGFHLKPKKDKIDYVTENTFRISVTTFLDLYNFDHKAIKKECVHIITPDLKKIPFSAYNMLYRKPYGKNNR